MAVSLPSFVGCLLEKRKTQPTCLSLQMDGLDVNSFVLIVIVDFIT